MTGESSYQSVTGSSSAPVCWASSAGPGGHPRRLAEERHLDAGGGQVAVGDQADQAAARSRRASVPKAAPPRVRQHLHAQALAVGDEAVVERLGLEPLGDRGERASPGSVVTQAPARSQLARCGSARIDAPAGGEAVGQVVHVLERRSRSLTRSALQAGSRKDSIQ